MCWLSAAASLIDTLTLQYLGNLDAKRDWCGLVEREVDTNDSGATRATTSRACGACCRPTRPMTTSSVRLPAGFDRADVSATGETHPVREFVEKAFAVVGTQIVWEGTAEEEVGKDAKSGRVLVRVGPCPSDLDIR